MAASKIYPDKPSFSGTTMADGTTDYAVIAADYSRAGLTPDEPRPGLAKAEETKENEVMPPQPVEDQVKPKRKHEKRKQ